MYATCLIEHMMVLWNGGFDDGEGGWDVSHNKDADLYEFYDTSDDYQ